MFHNISNPKWFGNWSRLEDDYLGNGGTDIADNFTFSKMEKTSFRQNSRLPTVRNATISWHSSGFSWNGARAKTSLWKD